MLMDIIHYLLNIIKQLYLQNRWMLNFICRNIPIRQWTFDDSHSPKYQKFKTDQLPKIICNHQDWDWQDLNTYYTKRYGAPVFPVKNAISLMNVHALAVKPPNHTCTAITARLVSYCAKYVILRFLQKKIISPKNSP